MQERKNFRCRMALYALLVLVCFLLQFSRGTRLTLWGASPDVLPFLFAAVALFEGPYVGAIFGFAGGILLSVNSTAPEALLSMYYSLGCLGAGFFASRYMRRVFPTLLMCGIFLSLCKTLLSFFFFYALVYEAHSPGLLLTAGKSLLLSLPFSLVVYLIVKHIHSRFTAEE